MPRRRNTNVKPMHMDIVVEYSAIKATGEVEKRHMSFSRLLTDMEAEAAIMAASPMDVIAISLIRMYEEAEVEFIDPT